MVQKIEQVNRFSGGIDGSIDSPLVKHFDIFSDPNRLIPHRSTEADTSTNVSATDAKQYDIRDFQLGLDGKLYALGKVVATGFPKVVKKNDPTTGNWLSSGGGNISTAEGEGNAARLTGCFIEWQGNFWFFQGTNQVAKCTLAGVITNTVTGALGTTITSVAQGVVGADDNLYLFYNNKIVKVSPAGVVTDNVLANLPSDMRIVSACRWGSYIAIGMAYGTSATAIPSGVSKVFIWDMVTSTTVNDVIDWGEGALRVLGNIEGRLVGVSDKYLTNPISLVKGSMVVRMWGGGIPQIMKEIVANQLVTADSSTVTRFPRSVVIKDNRMFWAASVPFQSSTSTESTYHLGIWAFGRKDVNSDFALSLDYVEEAVSSSNFFINSFGNAGNYWFINHSADGSVTKTDDAVSYTYTSIYERTFGNGKQKNKVVGVSVMTDYLPTTGQVVLKYKKDEETSFTTIFTNTTDNSIRRSAINIESSGANLPTYQKIRFRIESTGGAVPTGFMFLREEVNDDFY